MSERVWEGEHNDFEAKHASRKLKLEALREFGIPIDDELYEKLYHVFDDKFHTLGRMLVMDKRQRDKIEKLINTKCPKCGCDVFENERDG